MPRAARYDNRRKISSSPIFCDAICELLNTITSSENECQICRLDGSLDHDIAANALFRIFTIWILYHCLIPYLIRVNLCPFTVIENAFLVTAGSHVRTEWKAQWL